ncbi:MAG: hypothetical protein GY757_23050 [bacterium]|nr:hypothetical protein [bacterium]
MKAVSLMDSIEFINFSERSSLTFGATGNIDAHYFQDQLWRRFLWWTFGNRLSADQRADTLQTSFLGGAS